jgi:hypothetical protein
MSAVETLGDTGRSGDCCANADGPATARLTAIKVN